MPSIAKIALAFACLTCVAGIGGCGPKKPAAKPDSKPANNVEGPVLPMPQQPPSGAPSEGEPAGKSSAIEKSASPAGAEQAAAPNEGEPTGGEAVDPKVAAKIKATLAKLSVDDRALAEKQKICPVSGELLGTMGPPKKVSVAGHDVFICCEGCEESLTSEPVKFLAKIGLQPASAPK
jgi:hypothetical protein